MEKSEKFTGLGMPVFMAFGWAGEETAQKYALDQLAAICCNHCMQNCHNISR